MIENAVNGLILFILAISTVVGILDYAGFLPSKLKDKLRFNRVKDTLLVLECLGIDIDKYKRSNQSFEYPQKLAGEEIEKAVQKELEKHVISEKLSVGHQRPTEMEYYYDVIGATCNSQTANYFAQILSSYWSANLISTQKIKNYDFDFVVTPKSGSPLLGYEFAKLIVKPFVLYEMTPRFAKENDMRTVFDCDIVPSNGQKALIVDDSTTGGSMVCNLVEDLKKYGYQVSTCFVLFEPQNKNARERLEKLNIDLVSIVKTHEHV